MRTAYGAGGITYSVIIRLGAFIDLTIDCDSGSLLSAPVLAMFCFHVHLHVMLARLLNASST
jgi:hypothetical protein